MIEMFLPSSHRNNTYSPTSKPEDIPDPYDWIQEHRSLAHIAHTLSLLNGIQEGEDFYYTPEGELVIGLKARDLLKANCDDQDWQYVRNYLSIQKI
ncbi:MAG: hypothetical protein WAN66_11190 [Limnoraphis robusta]|jgi:hypothetical protein